MELFTSMQCLMYTEYQYKIRSMLTEPLITDYNEEAMLVNKHQSRRPANSIISKPFLILRSENRVY